MMNKLSMDMLALCMILATIPLAAYAAPPDQISVAGNVVGSYRYAEMNAQSGAIEDQFGTKVRALPLGNAVARAIALRQHMADFWQSCSAYYSAFEGSGDFGAKKWGPQPIRLLLMSNRAANFSPAVRGDSPIASLSDLRDKKVAWVVGNSGINIQTKAYLSGGGLTTDDVELVRFPSYTSSVRGLLSGQIDMALASNSSPVTMEVAASANGVKWIEIPPDENEVWQKIKATAPFVAKATITSGPGVKDGQSVQVGGYPCPQYLALTSQNQDTVYWFTKELVESWDGYKDAIKSAPYWKIENAIKSEFAVPYAEGAIRYFKEIDVWNGSLQARQDKLLKRAEALQAAFKQAKTNFKGSADDFPEYWAKRREAALENTPIGAQ